MNKILLQAMLHMAKLFCINCASARILRHVQKYCQLLKKLSVFFKITLITEKGGQKLKLLFKGHPLE
jgi:outer membrane lipoprotein-sorting protein